jgi:hypothetical protein
VFEDVEGDGTHRLPIGESQTVAMPMGSCELTLSMSLACQSVILQLLAGAIAPDGAEFVKGRLLATRL